MPQVEYRLTTFDNPYDPFTQFDSWFLYDVEKGYNTCAYLDRVLNEAPSNQDPSDSAISEAIDAIVKNDIFNMYKKVSRTLE